MQEKNCTSFNISFVKTKIGLDVLYVPLKKFDDIYQVREWMNAIFPLYSFEADLVGSQL